MFETSHEDGPIMLVDGYRYNKQQVLDGETRWRCTSNKTNNCPAAIYSYTEDNSVLKRVEKHNHSRNESDFDTQQETTDVEHEKICDDDDDDPAAIDTNTADNSDLEQVENIENEGNLPPDEEYISDNHEKLNDEDLTFELSRKGNKILRLDGFRYYRSTVRNGKARWCCCCVKSHKCRAEVMIVKNKICRRSGQHSHPVKENIKLNNLYQEPVWMEDGDTILLIGGYRYTKHQVTDGDTRWICTSNKTYDCPAAIYSYTEGVLKLVEEHNHPIGNVEKNKINDIEHDKACQDNDPAAPRSDTDTADNSSLMRVKKHKHLRNKGQQKILKKKGEGIDDNETKTKCQDDQGAISNDTDTAEKSSLKRVEENKSRCKLSTDNENTVDKQEESKTYVLSYERSRQGSTILRVDGFTYSKTWAKKMNEGRMTWRCSYRLRHKCKATVTTIKIGDETKVVKRTGEHNHLENGKKEDEVDEGEDFKWVTNNHGKPFIFYKGNKFNIKIKLARKTWWACNKARSAHCKASIVTVDKTVVKCKDIHNH